MKVTIIMSMGIHWEYTLGRGGNQISIKEEMQSSWKNNVGEIVKRTVKKNKLKGVTKMKISTIQEKKKVSTEMMGEAENSMVRMKSGSQSQEDKLAVQRSSSLNDFVH